MKYLGRHIMVKGEYGKLILEGKKVATIRLGKVKPRYKEMIVHGGGRPLAKIEITNVTYKKVRELTDEDAKKDGFRDLKELLSHLKKVYGRLRDDDWVTIIEFRVIQRLDHLPVEDPYMGLKPVDIARIALRYLGKELNEDEKKILIALTRTGSIRGAAIELYKTIEKRGRIRRVLKKVIEMLKNKGILPSYKRLA